MHQVGSKIWTTQWRNGSQIDEFGRVEFWTFNHQLQEEINIFFKTTFREVRREREREREVII